MVHQKTWSLRCSFLMLEGVKCPNKYHRDNHAAQRGAVDSVHPAYTPTHTQLSPCCWRWQPSWSWTCLPRCLGGTHRAIHLPGYSPQGPNYTAAGRWVQGGVGTAVGVGGLGGCGGGVERGGRSKPASQPVGCLYSLQYNLASCCSSTRLSDRLIHACVRAQHACSCERARTHTRTHSTACANRS